MISLVPRPPSIGIDSGARPELLWPGRAIPRVFDSI
jgi:hypothetical protein